MNFKFYLDWITLFLLIGFAIYTLFIIKNEKKNYLKNAQKIKLDQFTFLIPAWWEEKTIKDKNDQVVMHLKNAKDILCTWQAEIKIETLLNKDNLEEYIEKIISENFLVLDSENIIKTKKQYNEIEIFRIEGTGTFNSEERVYFDLFVLNNSKNDQVLIAKSKSSILHGLVEGPYFEKAILEFEYSG